MSPPSYVWEKMYVAVSCLCGAGTFSERLENSTVSSLIRLEETDLAGNLGDDLRFILRWTRDNVVDGDLQNEPNELERKELIEKMLNIMLETHRK